MKKFKLDLASLILICIVILMAISIIGSFFSKPVQTRVGTTSAQPQLIPENQLPPKNNNLDVSQVGNVPAQPPIPPEMQPPVSNAYNMQNSLLPPSLPLKNQLIINSKDYNNYNIIINRPSELDFLTKAQVFASRKHYVSLYSRFINQKYTPSEEIYGQITDGKPWWGQIGINCKGPGNNSIDGLSEESRFLNNPMLLFGVDTSTALVNPNWSCTGFYPEPIRMYYNPSTKKITVTYKISQFFRTIKNTPWEKHGSPLFQFKADNARDFGYEYAYAYNNKNITFTNPSNLSTDVQQIRNYLHTGGSCGYPGGCNNGSPDQPTFLFDVTLVPAKVQFKLWKQLPADKTAPADLNFEIIFE